ncbi:DUF2599 domain-containing protein [Curtobacterium flaccumfaciens]|uniref:DUF2599 domain-containing protein n=1 Tax=Curtobacterium flaccumfaciens TaxID=2035 RepID=UPI00399573A0
MVLFVVVASGRQFARQAPARADDAMWSEVAKKASRANTPTMKTQFDCHFTYARARAPRKPTWDLDSKRPNVSLVTEANYKCNSPDGGKFW